MWMKGNQLKCANKMTLWYARYWVQLLLRNSTLKKEIPLGNLLLNLYKLMVIRQLGYIVGRLSKRPHSMTFRLVRLTGNDYISQENANNDCLWHSSCSLNRYLWYLIDRGQFSSSNVHKIVTLRVTITVYICLNHNWQSEKNEAAFWHRLVEEFSQPYTDSEVSFTALLKHQETGALYCATGVHYTGAPV